MSDILWLVTGFFAPIPVIHLWLHALLQWWRTNPLLFYVWSGLLWAGSLMLMRRLATSSFALFSPGRMLLLAGALCAVSGVALLLSSIATLSPRRFFMWAVLVPDPVTDRRIQRGIFRLLPHPAYTGYLLVLLGGLFASGQLIIALTLALLLILTPIVIYFEDRELQERIAASRNADQTHSKRDRARMPEEPLS